MSFHSRVKLDHPVSIGGYVCPHLPSQPICMHLDPCCRSPNRGLDGRQQNRIDRQCLLGMEIYVKALVTGQLVTLSTLVSFNTNAVGPLSVSH
jgi:hypothetical protein